MEVDFAEDVVLLLTGVVMPAAVQYVADEDAPLDAVNVVGLMQLLVPVEVVGRGLVSPDPRIVGLLLTEADPHPTRRQSIDGLGDWYVVHGGDPRPVIEAGAGTVRRVPRVGVLGDFETALIEAGPAGGTLVAALYGGGHGLGERHQPRRQVGRRRPEGVSGAGQTGIMGQLLIGAVVAPDRGGRVCGQQQDGAGYRRQHRGQSGRLAVEAFRVSARP